MLGTTLAHREALRRGQDPDKLLNLIVVAVLSALVGARLYYVLFNWDYYGTQPSKIFAIWEGGLAIHGGLIAGRRSPTLLYCRSAGLSGAVTMDIMAPSVAIGQAIGRWGNFFNQEAFGVPTDLAVAAVHRSVSPAPEPEGFEYFHPTFLYESLWNLLVFWRSLVCSSKTVGEQAGALTLSYLGLYSLGRFFVEGLRIDSLMLGSLRAAQVDEPSPRGGLGRRPGGDVAKEVGVGEATMSRASVRVFPWPLRSVCGETTWRRAWESPSLILTTDEAGGHIRPWCRTERLVARDSRRVRLADPPDERNGRKPPSQGSDSPSASSNRAWSTT